MIVSTIFNGHTFHVGDLVWQQMWMPNLPKGTMKYGPRRLMKLAGIVPDWSGPGIDRWWLVDPERPKDESRMSWVESDWCDLEAASNDLGMLF
jgi:hypothetical protein